MQKTSLKLRSYVTIAMLGSIASVLLMLNFPIPALFPVFLEVDFSDVPALIAALTMGPVAGILVELIKNVLNWVMMGAPTGMPIGQMANFATGVLFILPVYYVFKKMPSAKGLVIGLVAGTVSMAVGMAVLNYIAFIPMYAHFMGFHMDAYETIVLGILPFNLLKGVMLIAIMVVLFRTMQTWIANQRAQYLS